jgi:opacity protein-like surface antigen
LKVNAALAFGQGEDAGSRNDRGRSYKTTLFEFSAQGEYYFIAEERRYKSAAMFNRKGMINNYMSFSSYVFLGVGGVYSRANVTFTQDPTDYDRVKSSNIGVVFPFGLGLKYIIDDRWLIFGELGYRYSVTDYIEGYKQERNSKYPDVYYFLTFSVGYRLATSRSGVPSFFEKEYRMTRKKGPKGSRKPRSRRQALE